MELGADGFVSNYTSRLDAKGRVSIPAPFRAVLARDGHEGLYYYPSPNEPALDCGGNALRREIHELLMSFPPYSRQRRAFSMVLLGTSENLKIDPEGRVILSERAKAHAGITSEVTFVGQGGKFQIWEPGRFRAHLEEATSSVCDFMDQQGSGYAVPEAPRAHGARELCRTAALRLISPQADRSGTFPCFATK